MPIIPVLMLSFLLYSPDDSRCHSTCCPQPALWKSAVQLGITYVKSIRENPCSASSNMCHLTIFWQVEGPAHRPPILRNCWWNFSSQESLKASKLALIARQNFWYQLRRICSVQYVYICAMCARWLYIYIYKAEKLSLHLSVRLSVMSITRLGLPVSTHQVPNT